MSKTLAQIFATNPTTVVNNTDLFYLVQSPYTPGTDAAITGADLKTAMGTGTVNPGLINQLAYYAAAGSTLSGLTTANNGTLITSAAGVPSILAAPASMGNFLQSNNASPPSWSASTLTLGGNFTMSGAFTFTGTLTGNTSVTFPTSGTLATTSGTVTNASNIAITDDTTTNASMLPVWVTTNSGFLPAKVSSTKITFNPSTATLTTTTFAGALSGNATTATTATNANNVATTQVSTNASFFPLFVASSTNSNQAVDLGTGLTFNPSTNTLSTTTFSGAFSGTATNAANIAITDDTTTNASMLPVWVTTNTGNLPAKVSSTKITFNPSTATLTTTTFVGALSGNATTATTATNATNTAITDDTTTNATVYPTWVTANTGNLPQKVTSTKLSFNPSTGVLSLATALGVASGGTGLSSTTINQLLYSSSNNVIAGLTTANNGLLVTSSTGVPSILAGPGTTGNLLISNAAAAPSFTTFTYPTTVGASGSIHISNGTNIVSSTSLWPNTVGSAGKIIRSDGTTNAYSTATFADTYTASNLLYSNGANTVTGLATANSGVLITDGSGVPSIASQIIASNLPAGTMFNFQSTNTTTVTTSSSAAMADVTNLSVAITPTSSSNKVLVRAVVQIGCNTTSEAFLQLVRGSTAIGLGAAAGSRTVVGAASSNSSGSANMQTIVMEFLDTPATTSATTYKVQIASDNNVASVAVNSSVTDTNSANFPRASSTISVCEIRA